MILLTLPAAAAAGPPPVEYARDVAPVFAAKCLVCHAGKEPEGGYDMGSHAGVLKGGERGPAVVPGKPGESLLIQLAGGAKKPLMPPKSEKNPLTADELAVLKRWVEEGAKPPAGVEAMPKAAVALAFPPAAVKPVRAVAVSPDGTTVAAGRGNQVHLFDAKTGEHRAAFADPDLKGRDGKPAAAAHVSLVESMAYAPDGKTLATGSFQEVVLWDVAAGKPRRRLGGFAHNVVALAYSPDGKLLAVGGGPPTEEGEVKVFDAATGAVVTDIRGGHSDTVFGVAFRPDGKLLATASADKFVKVWEVPAGKPAKTFEGHTHHVMDVGWTPDGKRLVSAGADQVVKVWDYDTGEKARDIPGHTKQVTRLAAAGAGGEFLTAGGDQSVRLVNAGTGATVRQFPGATDFVHAVAASPDGAVVAAGGEEGVVRLYDGKTGKLIKALVPPRR